MADTSYKTHGKDERDEETRTGDLRIIPMRIGGTLVLKGKRYERYMEDAYTVQLNLLGITG